MKVPYRQGLYASVTALFFGSGATAGVPLAPNDPNTTTPIKHVIVIVGENRSFDHLFGVYKPRNGQSVANLLSRGIVTVNGEPGPNFSDGAQYRASDTEVYSISPSITAPYNTLPPPNTDSTATVASDDKGSPFATISAAEHYDYGLLKRDLRLLTTGASGLPKGVVDTRIKNVYALPNGPFQLTPGLSYDDYAASPVHRFYQMWQQVDCSRNYATADNPSGCRNDLFPWVETSVGAGSNGKPQPPDFNEESTEEGATAMGFYNVNAGDMPYFKQLTDQFTMSDNYHQPVMGGTGANSIMLGTADALWYSDGQGHPAVPPQNQIENPDPQPGTNNYYKQDGSSGGSYSNCSDPSQPGVSAVANYLQSLPYKPDPNCAPNTYYLLNNYNPGYFGNGQIDALDMFTLPPSNARTIGDALIENQISWRYYGEGWNDYVENPSNPTNVYCNICNPFQYVTSIMTNEMVRNEHLKDTRDFYNDVLNGLLPAVSFIKPGGLNDGHPKSSKFDIFEAFTRKILTELQQHRELFAETAVLITVDEGGGYYDSGYIQPVDFFGDGTRIPLIVVSPFSRGGRVVHSYGDHASILKFIERNWNIGPLTNRSRDNLPNPVAAPGNPYVPTNSPAIGDLMDMFNF
jgi:phospholipase C